MRPLSWTSICILSTVLCATCLAERSSSLGSDALTVLERRQKDQTTKDAKPTKAQNDDPKDSQKKSAAQPTPTAKTKDTSPKPKSPSSSSDPAEKVSSSSDSSTSPTSSSTSSTSSTDASQSTSVGEPQKQSGSQVSVGGIVAGVILGVAVLVGGLWIAIAKWREYRRRRAHADDNEAKPERPGSQIPQDVLPATVPEQDVNVTQFPPGQSSFSSPPGRPPNISELPSSYDGMSANGLQAGWSVPGEAPSQIGILSPQDGQWRQSAYQPSLAAELPGSNPVWR